ncbi:MAG: MFS transporter [Alistipes sp.]|jgi:OPA family sugar phosphate sensor protein UhpC-like MFS transporter|nr:MFS transporter [Alistipes sp.]
MFKKFINFYKTSSPIAPLQVSEEEKTKLYKKLRFQAFLAGTIGYSLYYVCRTSLNVVKKPILDSGALDATQLGIIGSSLLFAYAIGKFVNGFLADYSNIKRFMATGLAISAVANLLMGVLGMASGAVISSAVLFIAMSIMWAINGWSQAMGSPPAVIALSRWYPLNKRGTYYGFFSASHNIGEFFSFLFVGSLVATAGWQWGFFGSTIAGVLGVIFIIFFMHDTPESKGLPSINVLANEGEKKTDAQSVKDVQKLALRTPAVWILALASAFMYISRYAINGWGVLYLQEAKGFDLVDATQIISVNALLGIIGTVFSGWISDRFFKGSRNIPALFAGVLNTIGLTLFVYGGNSWFVNVLSMILFGIAVGVLISFLGGLMAVDVVPRNATGAALGVVGMASYAAAGIQDVVSGALIDAGKTVVDGVTTYDFSTAAIFWIAASIISFMLPILNWRRKVQE